MFLAQKPLPRACRPAKTCSKTGCLFDHFWTPFDRFWQNRQIQVRLHRGFERFCPDLFRALKNPCPKMGSLGGPRGPGTQGPGVPGPLDPWIWGPREVSRTHIWTGPGTPPEAKITMTPRCLNTVSDQFLTQN